MGAIDVVGIVAILARAGVVTYGVNEEYIPLNLSVREPVDSYVLDDQELEANYRSLTNGIPGINKIQHELYISSASIPEIETDYQDRLINKGYSLEYDGDTAVEGILVSYNGFVKGFTGVGVFMTLASSFGGSDDETIILYTTGNIADYYSIYNWAQEQNINNIENL